MPEQPIVCDTRFSLGMKIDDEFVIISLRSGKFFHFNLQSEEFFRFFLQPASLEKFCDRYQVPEAEREYLNEFLQLLTSEEILSPCPDGEVAKSAPEGGTWPRGCETGDGLSTDSVLYSRPKLIRQGGKLLSEFEFSYP